MSEEQKIKGEKEDKIFSDDGDEEKRFVVAVFGGFDAVVGWQRLRLRMGNEGTGQ